MAIEQALKEIHERIVNAAAKSGRDPKDIKLVAVSKTVGLPAIVEAVRAGASILGENRVQEARDKISRLGPEIREHRIEWHLIGHLQKNKAKTAVGLFDLIQTVDSAELAGELNNNARKSGKIQRILVQLKLSDEMTKHGVYETGLMKLLERITRMENLRLEGLMTMPPYFEDPEKTRPYFSKLREIAVKAKEKGFDVSELSMGMSGDFEVAIEEGATLVRIGTSIFGEREY